MMLPAVLKDTVLNDYHSKIFTVHRDLTLHLFTFWYYDILFLPSLSMLSPVHERAHFHYWFKNAHSSHFKNGGKS